MLIGLMPPTKEKDILVVARDGQNTYIVGKM